MTITLSRQQANSMNMVLYACSGLIVAFTHFSDSQKAAIVAATGMIQQSITNVAFNCDANGNATPTVPTDLAALSIVPKVDLPTK